MTEEYLLNRSHRQYTEIDEFKNYELINCVAYEMAVRNSDILVLTLLCNVLSTNIFLSKKLKKFIYNNKNRFDFLNNKKNIFEYEYEYEMKIQKKLEEDYFFYTESHDQWIFCYNFSPVYNKNTKYFSQNTNDFEYSAHWSYDKYLFNRRVYNGFVVESSLGYIPPLKAEKIDKLDVESIDYKFHKVNLTIEPCFSRPRLQSLNKSSRIVSLDMINLSLPEKELCEYIKHLKTEFTKNHSIIKTPYDIINNKYYIKEDANNFTAIDWADSLFIYDYFKLSSFSLNETARYIQEIFNEYHGVKIDKLNSEIKKGEPKTKLIPYNFYITNKEKFRNKNRRMKDYYSTSTIKSRYKLMQQLIENCGYKGLIGG